MVRVYKQQSYFSQIVSKKAKITISFFMKNSKNSNIIVGFVFYFYVFGFSLSNEQNINLEKKNQEVELRDVIYGDVWVCSGQSNMQWNIGSIFNASEEVSKIAEYSGYGNTSYGVSSPGIQNQKDFCLKNNIPKGNY